MSTEERKRQKITFKLWDLGVTSGFLLPPRNDVGSREHQQSDGFHAEVFPQ
jgi:hypothetical protein